MIKKCIMIRISILFFFNIIKLYNNNQIKDCFTQLAQNKNLYSEISEKISMPSQFETLEKLTQYLIKNGLPAQAALALTTSKELQKILYFLLYNIQEVKLILNDREINKNLKDLLSQINEITKTISTIQQNNIEEDKRNPGKKNIIEQLSDLIHSPTTKNTIHEIYSIFNVVNNLFEDAKKNEGKPGGLDKIHEIVHELNKIVVILDNKKNSHTINTATNYMQSIKNFLIMAIVCTPCIWYCGKNTLEYGNKILDFEEKAIEKIKKNTIKKKFILNSCLFIFCTCLLYKFS